MKNFAKWKDLYEFLKVTYCQCKIITKEHDKLKRAGFDRKMPNYWENWDARYAHKKVKQS